MRKLSAQNRKKYFFSLLYYEKKQKNKLLNNFQNSKEIYTFANN